MATYDGATSSLATGMMVSYDGQSGAVAPAAGTLLWAEEGIGAYRAL